MKEDVKIKEVPAMEGLAAGSIRFAHSFTPESDEKTGIEKKESMIVTSAYDDDLMQEKIRTTKETQMVETCTGGAGNFRQSRMHERCRKLRQSRDARMVQELRRHRPHRKTAGISALSPDETELLARIVWLESPGRTGERRAGGCGGCV